jgi:hypothetical protein
MKSDKFIPVLSFALICHLPLRLSAVQSEPRHSVTADEKIAAGSRGESENFADNKTKRVVGDVFYCAAFFLTKTLGY